MISFQISALPPQLFSHLVGQDECRLAEVGVRRVTADAKPGYPCRVSLVDAEVGETLLLVTHCHHDVVTPYRSSGPIYVRESATQAHPAIDEIPEVASRRLMSVRAYDAAGYMVSADVAEVGELAASIEQLFGDDKVAYLHLHNAKPGCYSCRVDRVR